MVVGLVRQRSWSLRLMMALLGELCVLFGVHMRDLHLQWMVVRLCEGFISFGRLFKWWAVGWHCFPVRGGCELAVWGVAGWFGCRWC